MSSYLTRIYRRNKDNPDDIVGIVEDIDTGRKQPFKNLSELNKIIAGPAKKTRKQKHKKQER
jgi:hypothetical protein